MISVVLIGSGNLATCLAKELHKHSYKILQIYSKTLANASSLAKEVGALYTNNLLEVLPDADLYIFSVKDSVLTEVVSILPSNRGLWVHTAGSIPIDVFKNHSLRFGVLYPLQTFSKDKYLDFSKVPFLVEANSKIDEEYLYSVTNSLSDKVYKITSEQRKQIHLAAVFACNFTNHMYTVASDILAKVDVPFEVLLPLIEETTEKIKLLPPTNAQTGPAVRDDQNVMDMHLDLLTDSELKQLYKLISENITKRHIK